MTSNFPFCPQSYLSVPYDSQSKQNWPIDLRKGDGLRFGWGKKWMRKIFLCILWKMSTNGNANRANLYVQCTLPNSVTPKTHPNIILTFTPRHSLWSYRQAIQPNFFAFISKTRATSPAHFVLLDLIILTASANECEAGSSSLRSFL